MVKHIRSGGLYFTAGFSDYPTTLSFPEIETFGYQSIMSTGLRELHLGAKITSMDKKLFQVTDTPSSISLTVDAVNPPAVSVDTFKGESSGVQKLTLASVYVPAASEAAYEAAWAEALAIALPDGMTVADVVQPMP